MTKQEFACDVFKIFLTRQLDTYARAKYAADEDDLARLAEAARISAELMFGQEEGKDRQFVPRYPMEMTPGVKARVELLKTNIIKFLMERDKVRGVRPLVNIFLLNGKGGLNVLDVVMMTAGCLLKNRSMGKKSLMCLQEILEDVGLEIGMTDCAVKLWAGWDVINDRPIPAKGQDHIIPDD